MCESMKYKRLPPSQDRALFSLFKFLFNLKRSVIIMEVLQVNPLNGWNWIKDGFGMIKKKPLVWASISFVYL